jgi:AbrB family looped-hinge helix DNA binding protein
MISDAIDKDSVLAKVRDMSKITSKLQVTLPKRIAEQFGIKPGDEVEFVPAGDVIHVVPPGRRLTPQLGLEERLRLFESSKKWQQDYEKQLPLADTPAKRRDWKREDLYTRGKPR